MKKYFSLVFVSLFIIASLGNAQIPRTITHQGYLTNNSGTALDTTITIAFSLFQDSTKGDLWWKQTIPDVKVTKGVYQVELGPIDIPFDKQYWLEIQVGTEIITPRTKFTSVPYSIRSLHSDIADNITDTASINILSLNVKESILVGDQIDASNKYANNWLNLRGLGSGGVNINKGRGSGGFSVYNGETTELFKVTSTGSVGIGLASPAPYSKLHLKLPATGNFDNMTIESPSSSLGFGIKFVQPNRTWSIGQNIGNYSDSRFQIFDGSTARMTFLTSGDIGIATPSPLRKLHIGDSLSLGLGISGSRGGSITFYPPDGTGWYHIDNPGGQRLRFSGGSTVGVYDYMTISHPGNIGIGTKNPLYKLDIRDSSLYYTIHIRNYNASSAYGLLVNVDNSNATSGSNRYGIRSNAWHGMSVNYAGYFYSYGGSTAYGIYALSSGGTTNYAGYFNGNVHVTGTFTNPSDVSLKENIQPYTNAISKIKQLEVKTFNYKTTPEYSKMNLPAGLRYGFLAQDLEKVFPELVSEQVNAVSEGEPGKETTTEIKYKGIDYISMIPILVEAIKEQQKKIEELQNEISQLKNK